MATHHQFRFSAIINQSRSKVSPGFVYVDNQTNSSGTIVQSWSRNTWIDKAHLVEDLGYTTFLVPEHMGCDVVPVAALMAVADTTSLRIGSHVFNCDLKHPALIARDAAMLDILSDGRFELGLGCGAMIDNYTQTGIPFDSPGVRLSRFEEALYIIKRFFTEEEVTFEGQFYHVTKLKGHPKPIQKSHPPIYIGGGGKRVLSLAAREANHVGIAARSTSTGLDWANATHEPTLEKIEWIREAAGERFDQLEIGTSILVVVPTDHREQVAQKMAGNFGLTPQQLLSCVGVLIGTVDQMVENILKWRELYGLSDIAVAEGGIEAFAPVVAQLTGK